MKYNIAITWILLMAGPVLFAQDPGTFLLDKTWKVGSYNATFLGEEIRFYNEGADDNQLDMSFVEFSFTADGTYTGQLQDRQSSGEWTIDVQTSLFEVDGRKTQLVNLDEGNLTFRTYTLEYADTAANLDTVFYYTSLYPKPETVTGVNDDLKSFSQYFTVSPNPSSSQIELRVTKEALLARPRHFRLRSIVGKVVQEGALAKEGEHQMLDITALPVGVYLIEVFDDRQQRLAATRIVKE